MKKKGGRWGKKPKQIKRSKIYLLPHRGPAPESFVVVLLRFGLVDFDDAAVEFGLVHVVDGFAGVFGEGEFHVAEAAVGVFV
jgi:hypothetical protein